MPMKTAPITAASTTTKKGRSVNKRGPADIANKALRIFFQKLGAAYDLKRGMKPYGSLRDREEVLAFFGNACCYCGRHLKMERAHDDHLVPTNKAARGLHAWGNVVAVCERCNNEKHGKSWEMHLANVAEDELLERRERIAEFISHYAYVPDVSELEKVAGDLYVEIGRITMTLIGLKLERMTADL